MTEAEVFIEITNSKRGMDDMGFIGLVEEVDAQKLAAFLAKHLNHD